MTGYHQNLAHSASALQLRDRVARAFGRSATRYDQHADFQRKVADRLFTLLPATSEWKHVLDLGCGTGYCTQQLRTRYPHASLLALDLAEPMLAMTRQRLQDQSVSLLCGSADVLPLQDQSLDLALSSLTLQWCNPAAVFAELHRVLRQDGIALISTLGPQTLQELRAAWTQVDTLHHSNEFVSAALLQQMAQQCGFTVELRAELQVRHYDTLQTLAQELKGLGANVVSDHRSRATPAAFKAAAAAFASKRQLEGIPVSWEVLYLVLRKQ